MGGIVQQAVPQFGLFRAGGRRCALKEIGGGVGKHCGRGNHAFIPFSEAVEAHCKGVIVAARGVPVSSAKPLNAMDFYEIGKRGRKTRARVLVTAPASFGPLKYRITAGCESWSGGGE
ncbi:hypothetical protein D3C71_1402670 [compost metagenome]